jgi:hypothetical protein
VTHRERQLKPYIINDPRMTTCPNCAAENALVRLVGDLKTGKFCPYHGLIVQAQNVKKARLQAVASPPEEKEKK